MKSNLYLPKGMLCSTLLQTNTYDLERWKSHKGLMRVLLLNLMPMKVDTEMDIARTIQACNVAVQLLPMKIKGQLYKTTSQEYMDNTYLNFEEYEPYAFDRLIITGAPLEQISFEEVRYWPQLQHIMHWADTHVKRTLYICWAAQAGLYEHYGIVKHMLPHKMFGVFEQKVLCKNSYLMQNLSPTFKMPNSRHTEVLEAEIEQITDGNLQIIASGDQSGVGVVATKDKKRTFIVGHLEYAPNTLNNEYKRDLSKNLPIQAPLNYYNEKGEVIYSWKNDAINFYGNWLK